MKAIILIFKHATLLRLSNFSSESALTQAELDYQKANIDLTIQQQLQHLKASSQEHSVELFVHFIMATDLASGMFFLVSIKIISHEALSTISVFGQHTCAQKRSLVY